MWRKSWPNVRSIIIQTLQRNRIIHDDNPTSRKSAWTTHNHDKSGPAEAQIFPSTDHTAREPQQSPASHRWTDIDIVGLKTVLNPRANTFRRIIWLVVLMTCFALMLAQTRERLNYYLARPVSTSVSYIRNETLLFPSVTLCPYRYTLKDDITHINISLMSHLYGEHFSSDSLVDPVKAMYQLADVYDVQTLWKKTAWKLDELISTCYQGRASCTFPEEVFTVLGSCLHFGGYPVTTSGQFHGFDIQLCNEANETNFIGKFYLMVNDRYSTYDIRSLTHGYYLERGWNKDITLMFKEFHMENKISAPCSEDASKTVTSCISRCFHKTFVKRANCRMPYMTLGDEISQVPFCRGSKQLQMAEEMQKEMLWQGNGWHPSNCGCNTVTCSQYLYETHADTYSRHDNCASYKVFFTDLTYEETKQEYSYDIISLLCDIGGTIGLLLGASGCRGDIAMDFNVVSIVPVIKRAKETERTGEAQVHASWRTAETEKVTLTSDSTNMGACFHSIS